jgi:hypothetical protein
MAAAAVAAQQVLQAVAMQLEQERGLLQQVSPA